MLDLAPISKNPFLDSGKLWQSIEHLVSLAVIERRDQMIWNPISVDRHRLSIYTANKDRTGSNKHFGCSATFPAANQQLCKLIGITSANHILTASKASVGKGNALDSVRAFASRLR